MPLSVVVLAAGKGSRMNSALPKVAHKLAGKPLLMHVIDSARQLKPEEIIIVTGFEGETVKSCLSGFQSELSVPLRWVDQSEQLGTGHAVQQALPFLDKRNHTLILYGDVPLIKAATLAALIEKPSPETLNLLTVNLDDPSGYGRIIRDDSGMVARIVEHKDATPEELRVHEVNTGIMALSGEQLADLLGKINNDNAQKEYYLTDIIALHRKSKGCIATSQPANANEVQGVNTKIQLALLERELQLELANELMESGVSLADPSRLDCRGNITVGQDTFLDYNVLLEGNVTIGKHCIIEPGVIIRDSTIGDHCHIKSSTVVEGAVLESHIKAGPFARLRPGTYLCEKVEIGNFVEIKKSKVGVGSKAGHLSYLGDAEIGANVNIGAGTITCNYDGANKHKTTVGDNVFIGSDTQLIAPLTIGTGATVGAGTTVTSDIPKESLAISRTKQKNLQGWKRPKKSR